MLLPKMHTAATALQAHAVYSRQMLLGSNFSFCLCTCLGSNDVHMTKHRCHSTAASHQLCVQWPVLHASFWPFHHHISTVQPPSSCLHIQNNGSLTWLRSCDKHLFRKSQDRRLQTTVQTAGHARDRKATVQLSKDGVHQVVPDTQSMTADNFISDRCQDVCVVLPVALSPKSRQ